MRHIRPVGADQACAARIEANSASGDEMAPARRVGIGPVGVLTMTAGAARHAAISAGAISTTG